MIENCKKYLIKGPKVHSKTLNLYTVESNISKKLGHIQSKYKKFNLSFDQSVTSTILKINKLSKKK